MAKKKSKAKDSKKADKKKKPAKKKKNKALKKKDLKKKNKKKAEEKKKTRKKKENRKQKSNKAVSPSGSPVTADHSSNYNVREAVKKLRTLQSKEKVQEFTFGEKRLTVTRMIPAVLRRFEA